MTPTSCTLTEFAQITGFSRRTVGKWLDDDMPAERSGRRGTKVTINPAEALPWLIEHDVGRQTPDNEGLEAERLRLISEKADGEALENAKKRGEALDYHIVEDMVMSLASQVVSQLEGIPGRLANELVNESDPAVIQAKIDNEYEIMRRAIANSVREFEELAPS